MDKKQSVITNFIWRLMERGGTYLMNFAVSIVLARLLDPSLYGTVALVTAITTILQVFVDSGMANSLIQKKDTDDLDYSSVFYFNLGFCLLLYAGLFFAAPLIGRLYKDASLTPIVRVLGLTIVVSGVKNVQQAYVAKTMQFRRFFFATLGGTIFSAIVGIALAYLGYGVWALVFQQLLNVTVNTLILWLTVGWRPQRVFSWQRLKGLISYGWKLLVSQLLDTAYLKLYQFIIGLRYSTADLAFYNRAEQFPNLIVENTNASLDSVLLPVLSAEQDDPSRVREMTKRAIQVSTADGQVAALRALYAGVLPVLCLLAPAHGQPQRHQGHGPQRHFPEAGDSQEGAGDSGAAGHHALRRDGHLSGAALLRLCLRHHQRLAQPEAAGLLRHPPAAGHSAHAAALRRHGAADSARHENRAARSSQAADHGARGRRDLRRRRKAAAHREL